MARSVVERLHYYPRQFLGAPAFQLEQDYHHDMRRRHNVAHHIQGIVVGLELVAATSGGNTTITLYPGLAIDGFGREILVMRAWPLDPAQFGAFLPQAPATLTTVGIYVAYDWGAAQQPSPGFELCDDPNQFQVVQETFMLVPSATEPLDDPIMVDGKEAVTKAKAGTSPSSPPVPNDLSVPYQELPEDGDQKNRFVLVGKIQIDSSGSFTKTVDLGGRKYVGIVAKTVYAPSDTLTLMKRDFDETKDPYPDPFAIVDGATEVKADLTADADVYLPGDRSSKVGYPAIQFQSKGSAADKLSISRSSKKTDEVRVKIGDKSPSDNRFTVGPADDDALAVDGHLIVSINPKGQLQFDGQTGIGLNTGLVFRSKNGFGWVKGALTSTPVMTLDGSGKLSITGDLDSAGDRLYLAGQDLSQQSWIVAGTTDPGNTALGFDQRFKQVLIGQGWDLGLMDATTGSVLPLTVQGNVLKVDGGLRVTGPIISDQHLLVDVMSASFQLTPTIGFPMSYSVPMPNTVLTNPSTAVAIVALQQGDFPLLAPLPHISASAQLIGNTVTLSGTYELPTPSSIWCAGIVVVR
jgi:hypothetical protein